MKDSTPRRVVNKSQSRVPEDSTFYSRVVPILLVAMAVVMIVLILFALGVVTGIVQFQ